MKRTVYSFLFVCCFFLTSCSHVSQSNYSVIDLVNHNQLPIEEIFISDISDFVHIIPIETNDSILIGRIYEIKIETNKLYIRASNGVFVFDHNGKFLNSVGSKGRGPKEYLALYGIYPDDDLIWLLDDSGNKTLKFTDSGKFLASYDWEQPRLTEFDYYGNDTFVGFLPDYGLPKTNIMLAFFHTTGTVDSVLYRKPIEKNVRQIIHLYGEANFINDGNQIKFKHRFNDTIYKINNYKLIPDIVLHLGSGKANENARAEAANKDHYDLSQGMDITTLCGESNRYIYLKVNGIPLFYDKKEQKVHKWNFILPDDKRIDPEESKKFVPICIDRNGNLIGQTASANEEDNPVIIIAKLKQ